MTGRLTSSFRLPTRPRSAGQAPPKLTVPVIGRPPAEADLQRFFQVTPPSVHQMVITLERNGLIRRRPGTARSIEVLVDPGALPALRASHDQPVNSSVQRY